MPQIGFTNKQAEVYHRFNQLRRAYEDANGGTRIYNPDFLSVLMDKWEEGEMIASAIDACMQSLPNVSLRAYIADAEANDPWKNLGDSMEVAAKALNEFGSVSEKLSDE